jgi:hypothetical protein
MTTFLALYCGRTVAEAKMVAVTADPVLVATVAAHLLARISILRQSRRYYDCWPLKGA